jgi:hypothetical protein
MFTMTKLKTLTAAGTAVVAIAAGTLVAAPSASAMPMSCEQALVLARNYIALGDVWLNVFDSPVRASYYYGRADGVMAAACG